MTQFKNEHQPIMVAEVLEALSIRNNGIYVDATFGRGGHSTAILEKLNSNGRLLAMDKDPSAAVVASDLAKNDPRFVFEAAPFSELQHFCQSQAVMGNVDGLLLDLGVSSPQLDDETRGFSFQKEGPLDMRMDNARGVSAAEWINQVSEEDLGYVLHTYGEERFHRRIAAAIVKAREAAPITSTLQLANIIKTAHPNWETHKHPATRSFQAIRIYINHEMEELENVLAQSVSILKQGGRLVVLSFHSLEDRMVKQFIRQHAMGDAHPRHLPILQNDLKPTLRKVGGAAKPSAKEMASNVRARSAVLRVAEKVVS